MKKFLIFFIFLLSPVFSYGDEVLRAMKDEVDRTVSRIKLENFDRPYFVSCYVSDSSQTYISASFGAIKENNSSFNRSGRIEVRVGNPGFDNSGYISDFRDYRPIAGDLPDSDSYELIRKSLWLMADEAYKSALEKYSQKEAYKKKKDIKELYGDLTKEKSNEYYDDNMSCGEIDNSHYRKWTEKVSLIFRKYPRINDSDVNVRFLNSVNRFVDSQGSSYRIHSCEASVIVHVSMQNQLGYKIQDSKKFIYASWKDLKEDKIEKDIDEYASLINDAYKAEDIDYYVGPAIFEDESAAEFINQLFVRNISFNPQPWAEKDEWLKYYYEIPKLKDRIGKRVLPGFISVYDDPLAKNYGDISLLGYYPIDSEGVKPARLEIVKKGKLETIYSSRRPDKNSSNSNGHGRADSNFFPFASAGNVFFISDKKLPYKDLLEKLFSLGKEQELDYVLLIKKISTLKGYEKMLGEPVIAYKVNLKNGERTPINLSQFDGIGLRALRDIEAVSNKDIVYNFYQRSPYYSVYSYAPTSIVSPSAILIREIEIKKTEEKPEKKPYLNHPFFNR